jgi:hypothetical protein
MSAAREAFDESILDAENLLSHFDKLNQKPPPPENEVLKRAGLVMAMTAWETYVEDRVLEAAQERLAGLEDAALRDFFQGKLNDEIKRLHNPTADKTARLFRDYAAVDVVAAWNWNNYPSEVVCKTLDKFMKLRGDVVHRSRPAVKGPSSAHPVTKDDLRRVIRFLKDLVAATERALGPVGSPRIS